jgi:hypothetical protein
MKSTDDSFPVYLSIIDYKIEILRMNKNREKRRDRVLDPIKPEGFCE